MHDKIIKPSARDFRLMVLGQIISIMGSSLLRFALSLYVLDITGRADLFATLFAISNIPMILAPLGGAIADRFNRRNLMVIYDFSSSFIVLCLVFMMISGNASVLGIGVVMVLLSIITAMYTPSVSASVPLLVEEEKIESANGIVTAVQAMSSVAAPILGGFLYTAFGVNTLVIMSCIAFFLSAVMEIFIHIPFEKREQNGSFIQIVGSDLKDGFTYVIKQPFIRKAMVLAALLNFILSPMLIVGAPIIFKQTMQSTDAMYGVGMGLIQCASIIGALVVGVFSKWLKMKTIYRWFLAIAVLLLPMAFSVISPILSLGHTPSFVMFMVGGFIIAAILNLLSVFIVSKVQRKTPNENLGKVMAIIIGVAQCAAPVGQIVYGVLFETFRADVFIPIFIVSAVMLVLTIVTNRYLKNEDDFFRVQL